tara:strand:+ start:73 stop:726 length:654 start_codon:yes stop_codon:yes gene_type:complete
MTKEDPVYLEWWNRHQAVAFWLDVNGEDPHMNEIVRFGAMPLNYRFERDKSRPFFGTEIRPDIPELVNMDCPSMVSLGKHRYTEICKRGIPQIELADYILKFYDDLKVSCNKYGNPTRILPVCFNFGLFYGFMVKLLGIHTYNHIFHPIHRDLLPLTAYFNDRYDARGQLVKFPKLDFLYICSQMRIDTSNREPLGRCLQLAECMRRLTYSANIEVM